LPDAPPKRTGFRVPRPVPVVAEEPATNYALRMTEALDAISSAQAPPARQRPSASHILANLPPIRLPVGPAIPWRIGVPALAVIVVAMVFFLRPMPPGAPQVSRLPTPETYPVEQQAPLFTDAQPTPDPAPAAQPLGVPDSTGVGFDVLDVGLKLIAVLALAYGSLLLLKRTGMGGVAALKTNGKSSGMQVVSSLTRAPNRTVPVLKVPGGKTLLVGATPNQVNLIADLGELPEDPESDANASFFDILKGKIS
jgi:flagellar biogenesis protein FliO